MVGQQIEECGRGGGKIEAGNGVHKGWGGGVKQSAKQSRQQPEKTKQHEQLPTSFKRPAGISRQHQSSLILPTAGYIPEPWSGLESQCCCLQGAPLTAAASGMTDMQQRRSCCPALAKLALLVSTLILPVAPTLHDLHIIMLLLD